VRNKKNQSSATRSARKTREREAAVETMLSVSACNGSFVARTTCGGGGLAAGSRGPTVVHRRPQTSGDLCRSVRYLMTTRRRRRAPTIFISIAESVQRLARRTSARTARRQIQPRHASSPFSEPTLLSLTRTAYAGSVLKRCRVRLSVRPSVTIRYDTIRQWRRQGEKGEASPLWVYGR